MTPGQHQHRPRTHCTTSRRREVVLQLCAGRMLQGLVWQRVVACVIYSAGLLCEGLEVRVFGLLELNGGGHPSDWGCGALGDMVLCCFSQMLTLRASFHHCESVLIALSPHKWGLGGHVVVGGLWYDAIHQGHTCRMIWHDCDVACPAVCVAGVSHAACICT